MLAKAFCKQPTALRTARTRSRSFAVQPMAQLTTYVKAKSDEPSKLGDCPFCHRVLLTLETKKVPYKMELVDFANKPQIILDKAGGKVPLIHEDDMWMPDSDVIVGWLEEHYPQPSMASSVPAEVGGKLFGAFRELLLNEDAAAAEDKKATWVAELQRVEDYLGSHGPLLGGDHLNATDASLAPKLYHALTCLKHFKGWDLPVDQFPAVAGYMQKLKQLPAWQKVDYGTDAIVKGWEAKVPAAARA